ncbi:MAG: hypothetical protein JST61_14760 [Acidobacteria bacterium]|nr:hypothetical protein [Acidobacteriota bacterium]
MDVLLHMLASALVPLFFLGMVGSLLVVIITVVLDLSQVFTPDEESDV